jgi:endonuclease YncB( thermonuclease family)
MADMTLPKPVISSLTALLALILGANLWSAPASAHGGGLDASGCHNDRKRGGYHCHRAPQRPAPQPVARPAAPSKVYANCDAAIAAGVAPIRRGDYGYGTHLDRDGDGIGCENASVGTGASSARNPVTIMPQPTAGANASSLVKPIEGTAQVLDGDTIQIGTLRIRLFGIDAFEAEQLCTTMEGQSYGCGGRATRALSEKINGETISCVPKGSDAYNRQLAVCRVSSTDLSSWMVRQGHALAYTKYALDYLSDERAAKTKMAGAWNGSFELPWEFRLTRPSGAAESQRTAVAPSANCTIKGNVNKKGERIYHLPADPFYAKTKPENWFCSESEAEAAGFRRAGNQAKG